MKLTFEKILIIVLTISLVFTWVFRPSKPIDMYEDEINNLKNTNKNLLLSNDSLKLENAKGNIGNVVRKLNVNGVTRELSEYLNRRTK